MKHLMKTIAFAALCAAAGASHAWQTYSVMDPSNTPPQPSISAYARSVNDQGHVLVATNVASTFSYSLCAAPVCTPLSPPVSATNWTANAINISDTVAGSVYQGQDYAFVGSSIIGYDRSGSPGAGFGLYSQAQAVNFNGMATGTAEFPGAAGRQAFRYTPGATGMVSLSTLGGTHSEGRDINARGDIAGSSQTAGNLHTHAFMDIGGAMTDLGTLNGQDSWAYALNYHRRVVGCATDDKRLRAFVKRYNHPMQVQPHLNRDRSCALAVNRTNVAVGYSFNSAGSRAVIWQNNQIADLNTLLNATGAGWTLLEATGINTQGQIVGNGLYNGLARPFLLY